MKSLYVNDENHFGLGFVFFVCFVCRFFPSYVSWYPKEEIENYSDESLDCSFSSACYKESKGLLNCLLLVILS